MDSTQRNIQFSSLHSKQRLLSHPFTAPHNFVYPHNSFPGPTSYGITAFSPVESEPSAEQEAKESLSFLLQRNCSVITGDHKYHKSINKFPNIMLSLPRGQILGQEKWAEEKALNFFANGSRISLIKRGEAHMLSTGPESFQPTGQLSGVC